MDIVHRLRKSHPCRHQDEDDPRTKTTDTCVDSQVMCLCELEDRKEAADEIERLHLDAALAVKRGFDLNEAYKDIERLRERDGFIAILNMQIIEKDAEIERLREALKLERQLKDDALRAFNEAHAALKE